MAAAPLRVARGERQIASGAVETGAARDGIDDGGVAGHGPVRLPRDPVREPGRAVVDDHRVPGAQFGEVLEGVAVRPPVPGHREVARLAGARGAAVVPEPLAEGGHRGVLQDGPLPRGAEPGDPQRREGLSVAVRRRRGGAGTLGRGRRGAAGGRGGRGRGGRGPGGAGRGSGGGRSGPTAPQAVDLGLGRVGRPHPRPEQQVDDEQDDQRAHGDAEFAEGPDDQAHRHRTASPGLGSGYSTGCA